MVRLSIRNKFLDFYPALLVFCKEKSTKTLFGRLGSIEMVEDYTDKEVYEENVANY